MVLFFLSAAPGSAPYKGRTDSNSKENAVPGGMSRPKTSHVSTSSSTGESPKVAHYNDTVPVLEASEFYDNLIYEI